MEKSSGKNTSFLFTALLAVTVVIAILKNIVLFSTPSDPDQPHITAVTRQIVPLRANEILPKLHTTDGQPTLLMVYASWCPYCKQVMPALAELVRNHDLGGVHPLFVSVDANFTALGAYLVQNHYESLFTPYVAKQSGINSLPKAMEKTGSGFTGFIPYIGFFDKDGKMVAEFKGVVDKKRLLETAQQLTH